MTKRINFGKLNDILDIPDLIDIQIKSYQAFLQASKLSTERDNQGLEEVFNEVFPIESVDKEYVLHFDSYIVGEPKHKVVDCLKDGLSYDAPLHAQFTLETKSETITEKVFMGDMPVMTDKGTFIINGVERVIISQIHRSPGICFEKSKHASGKPLYSYRIIPDRGSWLEVQFDINDHIYIFLDRRRRTKKFFITTFLRAIGYETNAEILGGIYDLQSHTITSLLKKKDLSKYYFVDDVVNDSDEVLIDELSILNENHLELLQENGIKKIQLVHIPDGDDYIISCLQRDHTRTQDESLKEIYRRLRPGDPVSAANAKSLLKRNFFDIKRYDLGVVGRYKINEKLELNLPIEERVLNKEDVMAATKELVRLQAKKGKVDDIDHLGARRVKTVGELLQNSCRQGLLKTERSIRERFNLFNDDTTTITPNKIMITKSFSAQIREFFQRNQLSQLMDQTNPLSEMTNKRRLSALGPGGLSRERAGFEVRDVHTSHYGRICPIETPEGPNIGLITSLALYARVNQLGFLETPYRKVENGVVSDKVDYLTADLEEKYAIAQANAEINDKGEFVHSTVMSRLQGESLEIPASKISYMDVSPKQLVSAAAGLIPFLEHDDANRALMGSNMQRQSVPLLITESPLVGTGLEEKIAKDSRAVISAKNSGIVAEVSADKILITVDGKSLEETSEPTKAEEYELIKFLRTNSGTCINQRPIVKTGDKIKVGDVIADGASTQDGELGLGKNILVAFMPWCGYNFEDSIVISEKVYRDDVYTSIHIDEFEIQARDTKLGPEEITRDIPNVSEDALSNLESNGIVRLGAEVKPGDILVGKITPKTETELAPEERLLRAIFGEKAADVKDSSLTVKSGKGGIVMDIRVEYANDPNKTSLTKQELKRQNKSIKEAYKGDIAALTDDLADRLADVLLGQKLPYPIYDDAASKPNAVLIPTSRKVTNSTVKKIANKWRSYRMEDCDEKVLIDEIVASFKPKFEEVEQRFKDQKALLEKGEGVEPGVIKKVKVYVASKRKLQVGDKMAGRHGNKGIVSNIVPIEDMPFLPDGTTVDIILNPLGVPSRMNIGQVLETHLGWAAKVLGMKVASPVFDGVREENIIDLVRKANDKIEEDTGEQFNFGFVDKDGQLEFDGKVDLFDGRTGEKFEQRVMVGQIYMLKLDHLVANKLHARAVGPYSLVTQQPLGGKAQHGGQRFGEMEVWALEAYGAAYTLQEMLTVKSDDVNGRARIYESIVRGQCVLSAGRPESFNVLLKEIQSLGLDIRTVKKDEIPN